MFSFLNGLLSPSVSCHNQETVELDNPAFAQLDPHLKVDETEEIEINPFGKSRFPNKPPSFDSLLNNIKAITKKVEHIKGFKFEISGGLSNNFHLSHTWNIPNPGAQPQKKILDGFKR